MPDTASGGAVDVGGGVVDVVEAVAVAVVVVVESVGDASTVDDGAVGPMPTAGPEVVVVPAGVGEAGVAVDVVVEAVEVDPLSSVVGGELLEVVDGSTEVASAPPIGLTASRPAAASTTPKARRARPDRTRRLGSRPVRILLLAARHPRSGQRNARTEAPTRAQPGARYRPAISK
jgi:hypothetical protein